MLDEMDAALEPLLKLFKRARANGAELDKRVRESQMSRDALSEYERLVNQKKEISELRKKERKVRLKEFVEDVPKSSEVVIGEVKIVSSNEGDSETRSLIAWGGNSLTRWRVKSQPMDLARTTRYLCVLPETGKLGWARVMKTRITFVGAGVNFSSALRIGDQDCDAHFSADWSESPEFGRNLSVEIRKWNSAICVVSFWIGLDVAEMLDVRSTDSLSESGRTLIDWIQNNHADLTKQCLARVLTPFVYSKNLHGVQAQTYFGDVGTVYLIQVALIEKYPVLVVKKVDTESD